MSMQVWNQKTDPDIAVVVWCGHPRLQQNYTGPDMTPRWNIVFWSFLTKTWKVWAFPGPVYGQKTLYALQLAL